MDFAPDVEVSQTPLVLGPDKNSLIFASPDEIEVPAGRQRKEFNEKRLKELADSIDRVGLLHPLIVEVLDEGRLKLIAGERRLRACRVLLARPEPPLIRFGDQQLEGFIPCIEYSSLDAKQRYEMELAENVDREDLTWQEKAAAMHKFHNWKVEQAAAAGEPYSLARTRETLQVKREILLDAQKIAPHLSNPEVAAAGSAKEAMKIIERQAAAQHRAKLAVHFDRSKSEHFLIRGEAIAELRKLSSATFDVICTDPPYGVGADKFGEQAVLEHKYDDKPEIVKKLLEDFALESYRLAKPTACLYLFCAPERFDELHLTYTLAGWHVRSRPMIWHKLNNGMLPVPDKEPRNTYECILYAYREEFRVYKQAMPDVLTYAPPSRLLHSAQKPAALLADLLGRVALPGGRVLDAFAGSGSIFLACNSQRLLCTAIEKEEDYYNIALTRILHSLKDEHIDHAPDLQL